MISPRLYHLIIMLCQGVIKSYQWGTAPTPSRASPPLPTLLTVCPRPAILNHLHDHHAVTRCNKELQAQVDQLVSWSVEELHW